ncbi:unnamed protein product [Ectocarpus fasciculatus]
MPLPSDSQRRRGRLQSWRGSVSGSGILIGLQLLARGADGFNPPLLQASAAGLGVGLLSLAEQRRLPSTCTTRSQSSSEDSRRPVTTDSSTHNPGSRGCHGSRRGARRVNRLGAAAADNGGPEHQRRNGYEMEEGWEGRAWAVEGDGTVEGVGGNVGVSTGGGGAPQHRTPSLRRRAWTPRPSYRCPSRSWCSSTARGSSTVSLEGGNGVTCLRSLGPAGCTSTT